MLDWKVYIQPAVGKKIAVELDYDGTLVAVIYGDEAKYDELKGQVRVFENKIPIGAYPEVSQVLALNNITKISGSDKTITYLNIWE
jgi:hypothetical protein